MAALAFGVGLYAVFTWVWTPVHYIHLMLVTLLACIAVALVLNWLMGGKARFAGLAAA
jgi:SSS family solute:Na+ symporter